MQKAQGTIEYLVIIAIIIVIGLIVAGISTNMFDIQQITQTNDQLKGQLGVGGISVIESITNTSNDTGLLNFKNNSGETITITKITTENGENKYNETIQQGNNELIQLTNTCECEPNQKTKTCEFQITYKTKHGLEKTITQKTIIQCEDNPEPTEDPILPDHCFKNENELIQICSLQDLNQIRDKLDGNYILMKDIDASETINWNGILGWEPIGNSENEFTGTLNGNNKTIRGLYINKLDNFKGLFGKSAGANLSNIKLVDYNITRAYSTLITSYYYVGGLIGSASDTSINNVSATGVITDGGNSSGSYIGGLIGQNTGTVSNSYSSVDINAGGLSYVGGLIGQNTGTVSNSYSLGNVTGVFYAGGLIGINSSTSSLYRSYSLSNVNINTIYGDYSGGLVGQNRGLIYDSYAKGNVINSGDYAGGLIGRNYGGSVYNSYSTSTVICGVGAGGLIGRTYSNGSIYNQVSNSYAIGNTTSTFSHNGLIGSSSNYDTLSNLYWDTNLTTQSNCYNDSNTNCNSTNNELSRYYSEIPTTIEWSTDIWNITDNALPILAWQVE